jgi:hypothetical protein
MLTGLEILLARMKTNPEEFLTKNGTVPYDGEMFGGKWSDLLDYAWRVANNDEREMITKARDEFYRDDFNERVFKRLAGEENVKETVTYKASGQYTTGHADPRGGLFGIGVGNGGTGNTNTMTIGSQTIEEYEQQKSQCYAQIQREAMKEEMAQRQYDAMRQSEVPFGGKGGFFKKFGW